jgi:hypothetical protein
MMTLVISLKISELLASVGKFIPLSTSWRRE